MPRSAAIRKALRLMESLDRIVDKRFARLQADVDAGLRQLDVGRSLPFNAEAVERIKQAGRAKLAAQEGATDLPV